MTEGIDEGCKNFCFMISDVGVNMAHVSRYKACNRLSFLKCGCS